jgi:hypothetical protein
LDADELRQRIQRHLEQHAAEGDAAAMAVEEVVMHHDTGKVTIQEERVMVKPRPRNAETGTLAGEQVFGLPVEWYFRMVWLPTLVATILVVIITLRGSALSINPWILPLVAVLGLVVGIISARRGATWSQVMATGVTAGASTGLLSALIVLIFTWKLVAFLNIVVQPAYFALIAGVTAPLAGFAVRRWWR